MSVRKRKSKVAIVGAGAVGATTAFALTMSGAASEIVLVDIDKEKAEGEAMDLSHGAYFTQPVNITTGDYEDTWDADVVVITAGASQKPGESRLDLMEKNVNIFKDMVPKITEGLDESSVVLVVTNPVDILSYVTWKVSDLPSNRVFGSGTVLDTSRFRHVLSRNCDVDPRNVHAYVLGEHGDTEVPIWSTTNMAGVPFDKYCQNCSIDCGGAAKEAISEEVREAAYDIIEKKGATYYAIGLATEEIVETILRDENSILTVSTLVNGQHGIDDVYMALPCVINSDGVREVIEFDVTEEEQAALQHSGQVLKDKIEHLDI